MNPLEAKKIHFIGLGGIGVSAVAKFFKLRGAEVSGSDLEISEITDECEKLGIKFFHGQRAENLSQDTELVVYSDAVPVENLEREQAAKLGITQMSYAEILGEISKTKRTIAVSGTNGKSTTTAMLGLILEAAGFDPTVIVGSKVKTFKYGNLRMGAGDWFVVEGDEYKAHMLHLRPEVIILTNLEEDHLDFYKDLDDIIDKFSQYLNLLPDNGYCIINNNDAGCKKLKNTDTFQSLSRTTRRLTKYSIENNKEVDFFVESVNTKAGEVEFNLREMTNGDVVPYKLQVPGRFNVYNALAAIACARTLGVPVEVIQKTLANFQGIWRRFEKVGECQGALIISDYGHHPSAIEQTIKGARAFYPGRRIVLVFQPHQHNRTKTLFNDFVKTLRMPDVLILSEIYDVVGREAIEDQNINSRALLAALNKENAFYGGNLDETERLTREIIKPNDVVIVMGAGSIDKVARRLIN